MSGFQSKKDEFNQDDIDLFSSTIDPATEAKQDSIITEVEPGNTGGNFHKTVTTAGSAEQLITASTPCKSVIVKALETNTGNIYVGFSGVDSTNGIDIGSGSAVNISINNVNLLYIDSDNNGEGVSVIYINNV